MLVISRGAGNGVILADGRIRVTVIKVAGSKVQLGIDAPSDVSILRDELYWDSSRIPSHHTLEVSSK